MENYNVYRETETGKYQVMDMIRKAGGKITSVSGCGSGYYIQFDATLEQVNEIDRMILQEGATV